jgi:hypothetical protein
MLLGPPPVDDVALPLAAWAVPLTRGPGFPKVTGGLMERAKRFAALTTKAITLNWPAGSLVEPALVALGPASGRSDASPEPESEGMILEEPATRTTLGLILSDEARN